jgi:hypothetical protein
MEESMGIAGKEDRRTLKEKAEELKPSLEPKWLR